MNKKRIIVFAGGPVFPISGMHQVRIINQVKALSIDHEVDFCFLYTQQGSKNETIAGLKGICGNVIPVKSVSQTKLFRLLGKLFMKWVFAKLALPYDHFVLSNPMTSRKVAGIVNSGSYDIVISHYWQASGFLKFLQGQALKCIDTHYVVEENIIVYESGYYGHIDKGKMGKLLQKELQLQKHYFALSDLLIVNSEAQKSILENSSQQSAIICIPNGQQLDPFLKLPAQPPSDKLNLLFYGSLHNQFNQRAVKRLLEKIYPLIIQTNPDIKLIIMGSGPPDWLYKQTASAPDITITGFVEDVTEVFVKCFACIIPLESGSGFRGRTVELLAAGVPVVGTRNALESVKIENGVNGFVSDNDDQLAKYVLHLATDMKLRSNMIVAGRQHAIQHYSIEATFGKLSSYFNKIKRRS
jgi:polysaccharide biosynthesis protein PslH